MTVGLQRIVLATARFVGTVGWRQTSILTTRCAARPSRRGVLERRTRLAAQVFGVDSPNEHFDGDFVFLQGGRRPAVVDVKSFAYLLDYDTRLASLARLTAPLATAAIDIPSRASQRDGSAAIQATRPNPFYDTEYTTSSLAAFGVGLTPAR